ncbi:unnamed protein product [Durusdinium trenchii]|uniref:RanBP2-type domain-containing protein n=1 Tax=Durusdinium trenchii TaxID=1381693 RepID=A0ABP0QZD3_9DINO
MSTPKLCRIYAWLNDAENFEDALAHLTEVVRKEELKRAEEFWQWRGQRSRASWNAATAAAEGLFGGSCHWRICMICRTGNARSCNFCSMRCCGRASGVLAVAGPAFSRLLERCNCSSRAEAPEVGAPAAPAVEVADTQKFEQGGAFSQADQDAAEKGELATNMRRKGSGSHQAV